MMPHHPTTGFARDALDMGEKTGSKAFQTMAIVSMGVMAVATASQVFIELLKAINHRERYPQSKPDSWRERIDHDRDSRERHR